MRVRMHADLRRSLSGGILVPVNVETHTHLDESGRHPIPLIKSAYGWGAMASPGRV
jgi:hypothetical protein